MIILFSGAKIVKIERINKFRAAKCFRQWKKICSLGKLQGLLAFSLA